MLNKRPTQTDYNSGFAMRNLLLGGLAIVNAEIPLNRYGFFESLHNELLPNSKIELQIDFESDANLLWRHGAVDTRLIVTKIKLIVPRIIV